MGLGAAWRVACSMWVHLQAPAACLQSARGRLTVHIHAAGAMGLAAALPLPRCVRCWRAANHSALYPPPVQMWVLFRDENGAAACVRDECAHRACPLSLGSVVDGRLQCPYVSLSWVAPGTERFRCLHRCLQAAERCARPSSSVPAARLGVRSGGRLHQNAVHRLLQGGCWF